MGIKALLYIHDRRFSFLGNLSFYFQSIHSSGRGIFKVHRVALYDYRDGLGVFEQCFIFRQMGYANVGQHPNAKFISHNEVHLVSIAMYSMNGLMPRIVQVR